MAIESVRLKAYEIINLISDGRYDLAIRACAKSRLTEADIERVVTEYGRTLMQRPSNLEESLNAVLIQGRSEPTWSVTLPLWTLEEGRSDLTLELTVAETSGGLIVDLDDLRTL